MLAEFRVGNYRSFKDEQVLSLVASNDTALDGNCTTKNTLCLLKSVGIYGPNASGKSNLIKALSTMRQIITTQAEPGKKLPITPFRLDENNLSKPSFFEVTFYHEGVRYQYGFTATSERIYDEWLYAYPKGYAQTWFERKLDKKTGKTNWDWKSKKLIGERESLKNKTRDNVLFLSVGAIWNNKQLTAVYEWFSEKIQIIQPLDRSPVATIKILMEAEKDEKRKELFYSYINCMMQHADFGIEGINIEKEDIDFEKEGIDLENVKFQPDVPKEKRKEILRNLKGRIKVEFIHRVEPVGKEVHFLSPEESDGTNRFFALAGPWLLAIMDGKILLVDELDASLHPLLARELIKVLHNTEINKSGAQLVFATHDTTLLDPELFRRDQIWFTEKDRGAGTQLYSMSDYKERKPRKGEAMQKGYLSGRYGAIPILEAFSIPNG